MLDDRQLLRRYVADGSEAAFSELVTRYVNLVYSAAFRRTGGDAHHAQDVAQLVFTDLARKARSLPENVVLAGWLHRATQYAAAQLLRTEHRRMAREQEAVAMIPSESDTSHDWQQIRPLLDQALDELGPADRDALILRFFEQRSLAEVGNKLGANEDAARKRVTRALDKLRANFVRRGITTTAATLSAVISANAVQIAPAGLASTLSTAAITGTTLSAAAITATKTIAMTILQKTLLTATIAAVAGVGIYEAREAAVARTQADTLKQQQAQIVGQLTNDRDAALSQLSSQREEIERLNRDKSELLKLRAEVGRLRKEAERNSQANANGALPQAGGTFREKLTASVYPIESRPVTGRASVSWNQTLAVGNVTMPSGKTAGVFSVPVRTEKSGEVMIKTQIIEYPEGFTDAGSVGAKLTGVLTPEQSELVWKSLQDSGGRLLSAPSVLALSGQQGMIQMSTDDEHASVIRFTPTISADGQAVDLAIETWFAEAAVKK